jgi:hypothetical protein
MRSLRTRSPTGGVVADIALTTRLSECAIGNRLATMRQVADGLPATWEALNAGRITSAHLWVMDNVTEVLSAPLARKVEARVLETGIAKHWTPAKLRDAARRAVLQIDPEGAAERAASAKKRRGDVQFCADEDRRTRGDSRNEPPR